MAWVYRHMSVLRVIPGDTNPQTWVLALTGKNRHRRTEPVFQFDTRSEAEEALLTLRAMRKRRGVHKRGVGDFHLGAIALCAAVNEQVLIAEIAMERSLKQVKRYREWRARFELMQNVSLHSSK
jgi:hypothetical protein